MTNLSNYDIAFARKVNLPDYLIGHGFNLTHEGSGNFRVHGYQGLIVKENYWYRHSTNEYGNAIDFVVKFEKLKFYDAVGRLVDGNYAYQQVYWQFQENTELLKNYLIETRKIDAAITNKLIAHQKIKLDRSNCACFLGYDEIQVLRYVFRRSINSSKIFKGEVSGSCKEDSFQIIIKNNQILQEENLKQKINTLYIVEGAIDACAIATLLKIKGKLMEPIQIITTAGHPHRFLKNRIEKINPKKVIIATDMDQQGRNFAQIIKTMIGSVDCSIPNYDAKDPAELLQKISERKL